MDTPSLIDRKTNIRIRDKAPSVYLAEMAAELSEETLETILSSHHLPAVAPSPLFSDDFEGFLVARQAELETLVRAAVSP